MHKNDCLLAQKYICTFTFFNNSMHKISSFFAATARHNVVPYLCLKKESFHLIRRGKFEKSTFEFQRAYVAPLKSVMILLGTDKAL